MYGALQVPEWSVSIREVGTMLVTALFLVSLGVSKTFKALVVTSGKFQFASYVFFFFFA